MIEQKTKKQALKCRITVHLHPQYLDTANTDSTAVKINVLGLSMFSFIVVCTKKTTFILVK